ncbi:lectin-like domain-containing protein [Companilactobacillus kimchiensis]|uniref:Extracellular protein n=1 Tax=Companilactobacillus kimchiensis TaxID=993692 RepID=A0A0R2LG34_9LACO|nr:hypothetical protein [Companilactobacillus kimchiensis]KRN97597.1 hypothetical protein IV57_GL001681 [Companilactobacillus kimchiensis]
MRISRYLGRLLFISLGIFLLLNSYQSVQADTKSTNADYEHALETTPKGLNWDNNAFVLADFKAAAENRKRLGTNVGNKSNAAVRANSSMENNAEILHSSNPQNPDTSIIKMTNDTYQTGAVWSNMNTDNFFDISKEQKASFWLYLSKIDKYNQLAGDGMAFVLQNDPNGGNAIALSADGIPVNGQSLGVWGADWNTKNTDPKNLSKTAIQNSWALEFDTFVNYNGSTSSGEGVAFDYYLPNVYWGSRHIAGGYPALSSTYKLIPDVYNSFYMEHTKLAINSKIIDSNWHHVSITWNPINDASGNLSYAYDDKDPQTGKPIGNGSTTDFTIDTTNFELKNGSKKLYWGFTGSTGNYSENNLIVFESIPSYVDAEASAAVYDDSQGGQEVKDKGIVDSNDDLTYTYNLNYKGWTKDWNQINAIMEVPKNITFSSGTVTYPDSPTNKDARPIPESSFTNIANNKITYLLPEGLNDVSKNAIIKLKGKAGKSATSTLTVPSAHASFEGDNLITDANTVSYSIKPRALSLDSSSPNPINLKPNEDGNVPGQVSYVGTNNNPDYNNMVVHQTLNNTTTTLKNIIDSSGHFTLPINNKLLDKINTLSFYVTDSNNNTSNTINRQIIVGGNLAFGNVQPTVSFKPTNGSFRDQVIPRLGNWQIDIIDSREKGSNWTVQANASELSNSNKDKLKGHLFYRDLNGKDYDLKNNINVANNIKDIDDTQQKNITDTWTSNNGILLSMDKGNLVGQYTGVINWTLVDSLQYN